MILFRTAARRGRLGGDQPAQRRPEEPALAGGRRHAGQRGLRPGAPRAALGRRAETGRSCWSATPTRARPSSAGCPPCPPGTPRGTRSASRAYVADSYAAVDAYQRTRGGSRGTADLRRRAAGRRDLRRHAALGREAGVGDGRLTTYVAQAVRRVGGLAELGGKGASLVRLVDAGLPVPDGFCVTTAAYRAFTAEGRMPEQVAAEVGRGLSPAGSPAGRGAVLRHRRGRCRRLVRRPAGLLPQHHRRRGGAGRGRAAAGPRCNRAGGGLPGAGTESPRTRLALAVVVQRMVDADAAGDAVHRRPGDG